MTTANIKRISSSSSNYPRLLKEIYHPPTPIYLIGEILKKDELSLAVVGTRKPTNYANQVVPEIIRDLVQAGVTIISGLAIGIDALAHKIALECRGRTIAVLGSGLRKIYPASNLNLAERIIKEKRGALVSEYQPEEKARGYYFPARNRIISGLALGTLVIEAGEKSGALITSRFALEQNREVFAIPGSILSDKSSGPNSLIQAGAKLVKSARDILDELQIEQMRQAIETKKIIPQSPEEKKLLETLNYEPAQIDEIIRKTRLPAHKIGSLLSILEMKGAVRSLGGGNFVLAR